MLTIYQNKDGSFMDIWLSAEGDYSYHWERRRQTGKIYRWDNAPHHPNISTFPDHFHNGDEQIVIETCLDTTTPENSIHEVLRFVKQHF